MKKRKLINKIKAFQDSLNNTWNKDENKDASARLVRACVLGVINSKDWICPITEVRGDDSYYTISKNEIVVPLRSQYKNEDEFICEVLHNIVHSTGAKGVLGRFDCLVERGYAVEELVAEIASARIAAMCGIKKQIKIDSAFYLVPWLEMLEKRSRTFNNVMYQVDSAVDCILDIIIKKVAFAK